MLGLALGGCNAHFHAKLLPEAVFLCEGFRQKILVLYSDDAEEILPDETFPGNPGDLRGHLIREENLTAIIEHEDSVIPHFDNLLEMATRVPLSLRGLTRRPSFLHGHSHFADLLPLGGYSVFHGSVETGLPRQQEALRRWVGMSPPLGVSRVLSRFLSGWGLTNPPARGLQG